MVDQFKSSAPVAANLEFSQVHGAKITTSFDWHEEGEQSWSVEAETDQGGMQPTHHGVVKCEDRW